MGRKVALDTCMFCTDEPCDMHKPTEKAAPKPRKKVIKAAVPAPAPVPVVAPVADDPPMPAVAPKAALHAAMRARVKPSTVAPQPSAAADAVMDDAIRALAPLLHPDERRNRRSVLEQPRTTEARAQAWRERRGIA